MRKNFFKEIAVDANRNEEYHERSALLIEKAADFEILERLKLSLEGHEAHYDRRDIRQLEMQWQRARADYILVRSTFKNGEFEKVLSDSRFYESDRARLLELETRDLSRERDLDQGLSRDR